MGFFSKLFKGVKKVFKKIGKGIKKVATKVGKFMGKIGIVGQIAMSFILPGVGGALLKTLGGTLGKVAAWAGTAGGNALVQGAKAVIGTATKFVTQTARAFNTVTSGVKNFIGEVGKTALNKIPGVNFEGAANNFFGTGGAFERAAGATAETWNTTIGSAKWMDQFDPLAGAKQTTSQIADIVADTTEAIGYTPASPLPEGFRPGIDTLPDTYTPASWDSTTPSLLAQGASTGIETLKKASPVTGQGYEQQLLSGQADFASTAGGLPVEDTGFKFYEAGTGVEKTGINLTGEAVTAGIATAAQEYFSAPEVGYGGASAYGASPVLLGQYEVEEAAPLAQFGFPMVQFDIAQPGDAYYRPLSSWKRAMGVA
jgi:hypothetical protein